MVYLQNIAAQFKKENDINRFPYPPLLFDFITVSGWAIAELHHIPKVNEEFDYKNLHVTITKADQRKVLEVKVEIQKEEEDKEND